MPQQLNKRLLLWLSALLIVAIIVFKGEVVQQALVFTNKLLTPIYWALGISYLLNPLLTWIEKRTKFGRGLSVFILYLSVLVFLVGVIMIIVPTAYNSLAELMKEVPNYGVTLQGWLNERVTDIKSLEKFINTYNIKIENLIPNDIQSTLAEVTNNLQVFVVSLSQTLFSVTSVFLNFIMGLILSIYMLLEKETYGKGMVRVSRAFLGEARAAKLFAFTREANEIFSRYLVGKTLDSTIIGIICYIGLSVLNIRFALLFAIVVGVTNMIPYFGPIVGAIPIIVITVFYSPLSAFWSALFMLALQQADGNFIGPMILGGRVGISPMSIIVAVVIGGGLFGVIGMLLGVPVTAVIRNIVMRYVDRKLQDET